MLKFAIAGLLIVTTWILTPIIAGQIYPLLAERGQLGDTFGAVNALFSGLAFAGLCFSIWSQQQQLKLQQDQLQIQQKELQLQRDEMIASRQELASQVAAQEALVRAAIAHIAVVGFQAEIEGIKMNGELGGHAGRENAQMQVKNIADSIKELSRRLESDTRLGPVNSEA